MKTTIMAGTLLLLAAAAWGGEAPAPGSAPAPDAAAAWNDSDSAAPIGAARRGSTICQFMSGPKAHGWHDYAPLAVHLLGSRCHDGAGSAGIVVLAGHGQQY
jgi:hypothetical protein